MLRCPTTLLLVVCLASACAAEDPAPTTAPKIPVSLTRAHKGTLEIDLQLLDSYGPVDDSSREVFVAGRKAFETELRGTFATNQALAEAAQQYDRQLLGGPLLGCLDPQGVRVWVRTVRPAEVMVQVTDAAGASRRFGPVQSTTQSDLSAVVPLEGVTPGETYDYRVEVDGQPVAVDRETKFTLPSTEPEEFRLAFGSCFHKAGLHNRFLLGQVAQRNNRALVLLGDLAVDDRDNHVGMHRSDYLLRGQSVAWQKLTAQVPTYACWDDHDYFNNDKAGIPRGYTADDVAAVRQVWTENWNNPAYGEQDRGIYFHTRVGPADLIMLDTRSLRKQRKGLENAYLGDEQTAWLKRELLACKGPFTILTSGTMWSDDISAGKDSWGVWDQSGRESLLQFIEQNQVPGVLLLSGDRHGARGITIPRPSGYKFYEFEPASLGGMSGPPAWADDRANQWFGREKLKAFGEFTFDTRPADPTVTFRLVDESGAVLEQLTLSQSQLTPPVEQQEP